MTDHLEAARDRLGGLHDHLSRCGVALAADDLHAILSAILDHLEADPLDEDNHTDRIDRDGSRWVWCDECNGFRLDIHHGAHMSGYGVDAAGIDEHYGPLAFAPRPAAPQPKPDPLDEDNHTHRIDRHGDRWVWCDDCNGFTMDGHGMHESSWSAVEIDKAYGPLTFTPQPAEPQPEPVDLSDELDDLADCTKLFAEAMLKMKEASEAVARRSAARLPRGWTAAEIDEGCGPVTFATR